MATKKEYLFMPSGLYEAVRWAFVLTPYITALIVAVMGYTGLDGAIAPVAGIGAALETFFTSLHMVSKKVTDKKNK